jgi:hypothetical protein
MLKTIIGLVVFCLWLPFMIYALTHAERMMKKDAERCRGKWWVIWTYSTNDPLPILYLWIWRIAAFIACVGFVYGIIVFALRLINGQTSLDR